MELSFERAEPDDVGALQAVGEVAQDLHLFLCGRKVLHHERVLETDLMRAVVFTDLGAKISCGLRGVRRAISIARRSRSIRSFSCSDSGSISQFYHALNLELRLCDRFIDG